MIELIKIEYQSYGLKSIRRFLDDDGEHREDDDDEHHDATFKAIVIVIIVCIIILAVCAIFFISRCLYFRFKEKRLAKIRQQTETAYQQQNIQIESLVLQTQDLAQCPICLLLIPKCLLVTTSCNHKFHIACLDRWFLEQGVCPICRIKIHV